MSAVIGALRAELSASIAKFQEDMGKAAQEVQKFANKAEKEGKRLEGVGRKMSIALTLPLVAFARESLRAGKESAQALGQVEAALDSTGGKSGKTLAELQKLAKGLEKLSGIDDDEILKGLTANLLAFDNVQGDVFDRAQLAIVNLAARMGGDLQGATIKVAKALQDPVNGLGALSKAGIKFDGEQQKLLKRLVDTGRGAEAQAIILGKLEEKYNGAAAAMRKADPFADMAQSFRELSEAAAPLIVDILTPLVAVVKAVADWFTNLSPAMQKIVIGFAALVAAIGPVVALIGNIITLVGYLAPAFAVVKTALAAITLATWGWIAALVAVVAAVVIFWKAIKTTFTSGFAAGWDEAKKTAKGIWDDLSNMFAKKPIEAKIEPTLAKGLNGGKGGGLHFGKSKEDLAAEEAANKKRTADLAAQAKEATKLERAVGENDRAIRRFASGSLDPLSDKLEGIDTAYEGLRDRIQAQIDDHRELAKTNDVAASAMEKLEQQLKDLGAAHEKAAEGARTLYAAENHLRDLQNAADVSSTQQETEDLRRRRGQGAPLSSDMERFQGIQRDLFNQQQSAEIKLADLQTQRIEAETIGDLDQLARLDAQIDAQTELSDLLKSTSAEQLHDAERINAAFRDFADNLSDSLSDMLDNWNGDIKGLYDVFKQLARQLFQKPFLDQVSTGISGWMQGGMSGLFGGGGSGGGAGFFDGDMIGSAVDPMAGSGGFFSSLASSFAGFFAGGGSLDAGQWAIAGENGPEPVFAGHGGARIMSNPDAQDAFGGGGRYVRQTFNIGKMDKETFKPTRRQFARIANEATGR